MASPWPWLDAWLAENGVASCNKARLDHHSTTHGYWVAADQETDSRWKCIRDDDVNDGDDQLKKVWPAAKYKQSSHTA